MTFEFPDIANECFLYSLRKLSRDITLFYDQRFVNIGIRSTQYIMLAVILKNSGKNLTELSAALSLDRTTLQRNIKPLIKNKLVYQKIDDHDRRKKFYMLTEKGIDFTRAGTPIWINATQSVQQLISNSKFYELFLDKNW